MKQVIILWILCVTACTISAQKSRPSLQKLYYQAWATFNGGDTLKAMPLFKKAAKKGNAEIQCFYGLKLLSGEGVKQNKKQGWKWIEKSAEQDYPNAMYLLGERYYFGWDTPKDSLEGFQWLKKAADAGLYNAQFLVGDIYFLRSDTAKAVSYYIMADKQVRDVVILTPGETKHYVLKQKCDLSKLARIDFLLGCAYYYGWGVERNYETVIEYMETASHFGNVDASYYLGRLYANGFSSQVVQIARDDALANKYLELVAMNGNKEAQAYVGDSYMFGRGVEKDSLKAIDWYRLAAEAGHTNAQLMLTQCYYNANDNDSTILWGSMPECRDSVLAQCYVGDAYYAKADYDNAAIWWKKAADQQDAGACWALAYLYDEQGDSVTSIKYVEKAAELGHVEAINDMGVYYLEGYLVEKNIPKAVEYFKKAAGLGNAMAFGNLGHVYYQNEYGMKNLKLAADYFKRGAELGSPGCQYSYAYMLKRGEGVKKNKQESIRWLKLAADNGDEDAKEELKKYNF